jgi:predicted transcriptional regulator
VRKFGDLEAAIMDRLWERGTPSTVREILQDLLPQRELAYTTVLTVTDNLLKKGWLRREPDGRAHRYEPVLSREEYGARLMRDALNGSGNPKLAFRSFVEQMSPAETAALRAALRGHGKEAAS